MTEHRPHRLAATVFGIACVCAALLSAAEKRPISEKDLFKFVWIADPQISPDGSQVAFVRVSVDEKADQYETAIWLAKTDGSEPPRRLTGGTRDNGPRWAPDGSRLAFVRAAEKDGKVQPPQIYVMAMAGGEGRAVTDVPRGAGNPAWAPDGKALAFTTTARPSPPAIAMT
jgi:dipeptidyl aminopeptidase/acylaminoacyl peptidase